MRIQDASPGDRVVAGGPDDPRVPASSPGVYRRRIRLAAEPGLVCGAVEDDFHHFSVAVSHADGVVTEVEGHGHRTPWVTCPGAAAALARLVGVGVGPAIARRRDLPDPHQQCTHLYELALLACAHAGRSGERRYDIAVPDRTGRSRFPVLTAAGHVVRPPGGPDGTTIATLDRDGARLLSWTLDGETVTAPARYAGLRLRDIKPWLDAEPDDDIAEAIQVLRRGLHVSGGRALPYDVVPDAASQPQMVGACFAFQPERIAAGVRPPVSRRDFTDEAPAASFGLDV